jgi:ATP-dependent HslUV protease ATP-binding subunit HslU
MIGPTGVGKTGSSSAGSAIELAGHQGQASRFTEVGYVGRDVESHGPRPRRIAVDMVREEKIYEVQDKAEEMAEERLLDLVLPAPRPPYGSGEDGSEPSGPQPVQPTREKLRSQLREGKLDQRTVEIDVRERVFPSFEIITSGGVEEMDINIKDMLLGSSVERPASDG